MSVLTPTQQMARDERIEFASFLEGLTPDQWESPTLCDRWRVREVAIHTVSYDELSTAGLIRRFLKGRLNTDRINAIGVADYADRSAQQIIALIRTNTEPHGLTGGFGGKIALTDGMIHQQDIRRSIGLPRSIDPERLRTALDFARFAPTNPRCLAGARNTPRRFGSGLGVRERARGSGERRGTADGDGRPPRRAG